MPGVRGVAWATTLPMGDTQTGHMRFLIVGEASGAESHRFEADYQIVSPSYFAAVDLPIVAGRAFTERDTTGGREVCVVSEAFARRYLNGRNPIGQRVKVRRFAANVEVEREIVGVARQVKGRADETADLAQIYVPNTQDPWAESYLLVRTAGRADALSPSIRAAIARVDKALPVRSVKTLERVGNEGTARYRFRAVLIASFAALALVLAMAGLFGVQAYSVQQRWREFGVRIALGASTRSILALVLSGTGRVVGIGMFAGLGASVAMSRAISAFLFGVQPIDSVTFGTVIVFVGLAAATASVVPAMRATRVDPAVALRQD